MINDDENRTKIEELIFLRNICKRVKKKIEKKLEKQNEEYKIASNWLWYEQIGDSLLASHEDIPKGATSWKIRNLHTNRHEEIKLNIKLNKVKNAELYYKKGKKGKRGFSAISHLLKITELEHMKVIGLLDNCKNCLGIAPDTEEFAETLAFIKAEMQQSGYLTNDGTGTRKNRAVIKIPFRHFTIDGWDIYIGKNNLQNDELSLKFAKPWDIWFHVAVHAGSHVVLKRDKNSDWPPHYLIEKVAALAVWFSKAKHTSYTDVHVTEARFVRKRRKAPPGEVIVERCKTVRVAPQSPQQLFE